MITTIKQFAEAVKPLMKGNWSVSAIVSDYDDPKFTVWDSHNTKHFHSNTPEGAILQITDSAKEIDMVISEDELPGLDNLDEKPYISDGAMSMTDDQINTFIDTHPSEEDDI